MTPAEQLWYDNYQTAYPEYGYEETPASRPQRTNRPAKKRMVMASKSKARLLMVTIVVGLLFIGIIITNAFAATIKYNTNELTAQNEALQGEIENLTVEIHSANNIETIESKALKDLGMVEPKSGQCVYLND